MLQCRLLFNISLLSNIILIKKENITTQLKFAFKDIIIISYICNWALRIPSGNIMVCVLLVMLCYVWSNKGRQIEAKEQREETRGLKVKGYGEKREEKNKKEIG